jgi:flagellar biosynthesis protein FlhB
VSDKTEQATPKRLRKAQEEGDSPLSPFAAQAVGFVCAVAIAPAAVVAVASRATADLRAAIAQAGSPAPSIAFDAASIAAAIVGAAAPLLLAAGVAAGVTSFVQSGGVIAVKKLTPKLERLDLFAGLRSLFSATRAVAVVRAAVFGAGVALLAYHGLRAHAADLVRAAGRLDASVHVAAVVATDVAKRAAILGLFLAVLDVVVTRRQWARRLRMSKEEVKREHRESEGDPQLKAARERAHHEMLASAVIASVKTATVVVVNPTHIACALRYDNEGDDEAPVVVASGHGDLAEKIVEAARQYGVPVLRDVPLARALAELEVGTAIPEALYEAVAEILRAAWDDGEATPREE